MRRMPDRIRERWANGEVALNAWLTLEGPSSAALAASGGFDAVTVDLQHGSAGLDALGSIVAAIEPTGVVPFVRLGWNDPGLAMRALDLGARGLIAPMVNSADEARAFARACRYPPEGFRSYGAVRSVFGTGREQTERANRSVLTFAQIETAEGLAAVDEICSVDGLDGVYVGPADLSLSLGLPTFGDVDDRGMRAALDETLEAARGHGIVPGIHAPSAGQAVAMARRGFTFVGAAGDAETLATGLRTSTEAIRAELA